MTDNDLRPFRFDAEVRPGEKRHFQYEVSETYLGDLIEIPVNAKNHPGHAHIVRLTLS